MLAIAHGNCSKCGCSFGPLATIQSTTVTCKNCNNKLTLCEKCKKNGCPKCNGELESQMDWAANNDIMF